MNKILLVDDEEQLLKIVALSLKKQGYFVLTAKNGEEARNMVPNADIIFLDINMPDISGLALLEELKGLYPNKIFMMMTAYDNVQNAVIAMKSGAFNYLVKPVKLEELLVNIEKASEYLSIKEENESLKERLKYTEEELGLAISPGIKHLFPFMEKIASTDASVLLEGETGTGKSMIAHIIHKISDKKDKPFIKINCAAIPEQLLESEFFGYEKGAFTGASSTTIGKFEAANNGTIFLDEIGDISPALQAKLLQVTQDKSFMRLGSSVKRDVNVRIITATNRNLKELVEKGEFRQDLYYRLNIVNIEIPPLRKRKDDIPFLIKLFVNKYSKQYNKSYSISKALLNKLSNYDFPGNVRELENAVERAVVLCSGVELSIDDFPIDISNHKRIDNASKTLPEKLEAIEMDIIQDALIKSQGNAAKAARSLGLSRQNLLYKMNKYNIEN